MLVHTIVEALAYTVGFQVFLRTKKRQASAAFAQQDSAAVVGAGAIFGAALGAKMSYWLADPINAFADFPSWQHLLAGKSIVGGLLGGLFGVEVTKRLVGITRSTGDAFVLPLTVGMSIGRVGCYLEGLSDHTYGNPTNLPWGIDLGDGVLRHPTQFYEIAFLWLQFGLLWSRRTRFVREGDSFRAFLIGYLVFRLLVDGIKPVYFAWPGGLSGLQWLCIGGLVYYLADMQRVGFALLPGSQRQWEPK